MLKTTVATTLYICREQTLWHLIYLYFHLYNLKLTFYITKRSDGYERKNKSIILDWSLQFWISSLFKAEAGYNKNYNAEKLYLLGNWLFSLIIITWLTGVIHNTQVQSTLVGGRLYSPLLLLSAKDLLKLTSWFLLF